MGTDQVSVCGLSSVEIVPIGREHIARAKDVIYGVAQRIFEPEMPLEEFIKLPECEHWLDDLDDFEASYEKERGLLLVVLADGEVIGTGGLHQRTEEQAELKRIWLLEQYHGQQIGFRLVSQLLNFACEQRYATVYLETSSVQERAISFYKKLGFCETGSPYAGEIAMELSL